MARPRKTSIASETSIPESTQELGSMYDYLAKVILLGPSGAGKSCLLHRFLKSEWRHLTSQTIGVEFASKIIKVGPPTRRKRIKLQLWDTAGTERFRSVSRSYYRGAAGAILVYDVASLPSFHALPTFLMDAKALASPHLTVMLAGNKWDLTVDDTNNNNNNNNTGGSTSSATAIPGGRGSGSGNLVLNDESTPRFAPETPSSVSSKQSSFPPDSGSSSFPPPPGTANSSSLRSPPFNTPPLGSKQTATTLSSGFGREVTPEIASRWASQSNIAVSVEVSALSGQNVDELFSRLARIILTKIELGEIDPDDAQSGIQYGDAGAWGGSGGGDRGSVRSGFEGEDGMGTVKKRRGGKGRLRSGTSTWMGGMREWEDVFRISAGSASRRRGGCC